MLPEVKSLEAQLKQILYGCVEHVQATKAALYLSASHDLNEKKYELVTHYQYNPADRKVVSANDDLVDRLAVKRSAFFVNGLGADQRFAEMLFRQGNDRLLVTPLFSRGRLVGFIDMRDKAGKKPFDTPDVAAANTIAEQMLRVLASNKLYGLAPIALVDDPSKPAAPQNLVLPTAAAAPPQVALRPGQFLSAEAMKAIESARQFMGKRQLTQASAGKRVLGEADLEVVRLLLPAALAIPGAVLACFSAIGHVNNPQSVVAIATVTDDAMETLQAHLQAWLKRTNHAHLVSVKPQLIYPFGVQVVPVTAAGISTILSAPVDPQSVEGLVLTVAFERTPEAQAQRALQIFLRQVEQSVESAIAATSGRNDRQSIAERLLEPDFQKYPELAEHCREVSVLAHRFARALELPATQVETVRVAALVHDVGLRLLDYERLYKRLNLTAEEMRGLAEHPVVGAALVEPLLGNDVAQAVLRHHERVDGKGYPSRMSGQQIPLAARIIQIADAWVAMTARQSYQVTISAEQAAQRLREGAGSQFDAALVERFLRAIPEIA
ncbi:MAG TPA: HD domain-containing phosphohydrolase [Thermoanaerobaculia bacterium]|nr:HD domain-containing phosphohydrolase [Thermoanaerobaculia bacterium]